MDPEIQREFEEQLRQMNDMLSQTNSTMAGMVKAIQSQTAAISGNVTSVKTQTDANNQLSTSTSGRTKLAEAEAQALQKSNEAKAKFRTAIDDSSTALRGFGRALTSTEEGFKKYGAATESAGDAALSIGKSFGIVGTVLGGLVKGLTMFASQALGMHDTMIQMNRDFVKFTGVMPVTTGEMANLAAEAGYAGENMAKFAKFAASLNQNILALGDTAGQGAVKFAKVAAVGDEVYEKYSKMGISQEQLTEMQTYYIKEQAQSGRALALRTKSEEQLRKESLAYVDNMVLLSSMTGQQAEDMQREREVVKSEFEERVKVRQEELAAQAAEARGDQGEADRIRAESASRRKIIDTYTDLYGKEVGSMVGRVVRQGGFDEFTGGLAAAGVQVEDLTGQMNAATKEQLEAKKRGASEAELEQIRTDRSIKAAEAYQTAQDNFARDLGDAAQYSKELPAAFAQTTEALGKGENSIGKTVKERLEAAQAEKKAKEAEAKKGGDKDAAMRAEQETADRKFQKEYQETMLTLARTIMPTITAATNLAASALGKFNDYLNDINKFFADFKKYSGTILAVLGVLAGATGIGLAIKMFGGLGAAGKGLTSVFGGLKNAFTSAIGWLKGLFGMGGDKPKLGADGRYRDAKGRFAAAPSGGGKFANLAKGGARILGKLALPLTAGMAAYDAYQGYNADPNASFGGKMANAGKGALSGMTFGLSDYITGGVTTGTEEVSEKAAKTTAKQAETATKNEKTTDKATVSNEKASSQNKRTTDNFEKIVIAFGNIIVSNGKIVVAFAESVKTFKIAIDNLMTHLSSVTGAASSTGGAPAGDNIPKNVQGNLEMIAKGLRKKGFGDENYINAVLGNVMKESGGSFDKQEDIAGYGKTDNARIRNIFKSKTKGMSDADLDKLKADPQAFANKMYGDRGGNKQPGDGWLFRGRGPIQLTGRENYAKASKDIYGDDRLVKNPDLVLQPDVGVEVVAWFMHQSEKSMKKSLGFSPGQALSKQEAALLATSQIAGQKITRGSGYLGTENLGKVESYAAAMPTGVGAGGKFSSGGAENAASDKLISSKPGNVKVGDKADLSGMDSNLLSRFFTAAKEFGQDININSAYRGDDYQAQLWVRGRILGEEGIHTPARPKNTTTITYKGKQYTVDGSGKGSKHGRGEALDISTDHASFDPVLARYGLHRPFRQADPPHVELKAAKGGVFSGPSSGYPVELHGQEIVAPLTMDSILMKLAKTSALSAEGDIIEKALTGGAMAATGNNSTDAVLKMHSDLINVLTTKLDSMIDVLDDGNDTREKIFKHTMV